MIEHSFIRRWAKIQGNILYYQQLCLGRIDCQSNLRKNIFNSPIIIAQLLIFSKFEAQTYTKTYNIQNKHDYPYSLILLSSFEAENFIWNLKDTKPPPTIPFKYILIHIDHYTKTFDACECPMYLCSTR